MLAKKNNSAVICEIMNEDGTMARGEKLFNFAKKHKLKILNLSKILSLNKKILFHPLNRMILKKGS